MIKNISLLLIVLVAIIGGYDLWNMRINYNFGVITPDRVYKSGAMDAQTLPERIKEFGIKTVIDFRNENSDRFYPLDEKKVIDAIEGVNYFNIKSPQVAKKEHLQAFYDIMDNEDNYPVLIHCYHGLGRTMLYSALYRIEYEGMDVDVARHKTRPYPVESFLHDSKFASTKKKGKFLLDYIPRSMGEKATINTIK